MSDNNQLNQSFCPSPWFHMRITNSGKYEYCRWAQDVDSAHCINSTSPKDYFQEVLQPIRQTFLEGKQPNGCHTCRRMETHGKISGRQRQLLKTGVTLNNFDKSLASSPWLTTFIDTEFTQLPQDWQIDLGNYCNSGCIMCSPEFSSKLATEWQQIGFIDSLPPANWSDDPVLVQNFVATLVESPNIQYLHFIGGETVITPAFKTILKELIDAGLHEMSTIGFTTNLTVWRDDIVELLEKFQGVNLGMSVESFSVVNDYVRWPSLIPTIFNNLKKWEQVANKNSWLMQFRTTPTCLTVGKLLPIYDYALANNINVESCNFMHDPELLKPSLLPLEYRTSIINEMQNWIDCYTIDNDIVINSRHPNTVQSQLVQDLTSYVSYLKNEPDESYRLPELVTWLKRIESNRGNSVLNYLPEYEELFRSAGY